MKRTRTAAMIVGVGMHFMIGLMFGPVRWFAMLMATLLLASYLPERVLDRGTARLARALRSPRRPPKNADPERQA
jgi:hypothetical protein